MTYNVSFTDVEKTVDKKKMLVICIFSLPTLSSKYHCTSRENPLIILYEVIPHYIDLKE